MTNPFSSTSTCFATAHGETLVRKPKRSLLAISLVTSLFFPVGVSACSAVSHGYFHTYRDLEQCGGVHFFDNDFTVQLEGAFDLGLGVVRQRLYGKSTGCAAGSEVALILMDCSTGEAVAIGGYQEDPDMHIGEETAPTPPNLIEGAMSNSISLGERLSIGQINQLAVDANADYSVLMTTTSPISIDGFSFQLGCACQLYYPDSPGASQ